MRKIILAALAVLVLAACKQTNPSTANGSSQVRPVSYGVEKILANLTYNERVAREHNTQVSEYNLEDMKKLFQANRTLIAEALDPYLRTYDGQQYPQIAVWVYGRPLTDDGSSVVFHVSVGATISPREPRGKRPLLDDSYVGGLTFSVPEGRVTTVELMGSQVSSVPRQVYEKALSLAGQLDKRYSVCDKIHVRWLPDWYVSEYILPRVQANEPVAEEYSVITEMPKGHVVLLPFMLWDNGVSIHEVPMHTVVLDMGAERIIGVYKTTIDAGPMY